MHLLVGGDRAEDLRAAQEVVASALSLRQAD
jgi:hypothetical protein